MQAMKKGKKHYKRVSLLLVMAMVVMLLDSVMGVNTPFSTLSKASDTSEVSEPNLDGVTFDNEGDTTGEFSPGSPQNPFQISSYEQLYYLATKVANGESNYAECSYVLTEDITMSQSNAWKCIGNSGNPFLGNFDGQNHTISGITISADTIQPTNSNDTCNQCLGIFGNVGAGTIKNLTISSGTLSRVDASKYYEYLGLLAGIIGGKGDVTVENCHITGDAVVEMNSSVFDVNTTEKDIFQDTNHYSGMVGGLIGGVCNSDNPDISRNITITGCSSVANVTVNGGKNVGGIIGGMQDGAITDCTNEGNVYGNRSVGGIAGRMGNTASVADCINQGEVAALEYTEASWKTLSNNAKDFYSGVVSNMTEQGVVSEYNCGYYVGGIVGYGAGEITAVENSGMVTGSVNVGGVTGVSESKVEKSANTGDVKDTSYTAKPITFASQDGTESLLVTFQAEEKNKGGVIGSLLAEGAFMKDCSNQGNISGKENIGGVLGNADDAMGSATEDAAGSDAVAYPVQYSYNTGTVSATQANSSGGLIGTGQSTLKSYYLAELTSDQEDNGEADGTLPEKSEREFSSGEVCYYLEHVDNVWSQKLGTDKAPVLLKKEAVASAVHQIKVSTMFSETTRTKYEYCNDQETIKAAANITEENGYTYSYYLVGTGGLTDLEKVTETQKVTGDCYIAVKREAKMEPTDSSSSSSTGGTSGVGGTTNPTSENKKDTTFVKENIEFKLSGNNGLTVSGSKNNNTTKIIIPSTIKRGGVTYKVTAIADNAFSKNKKVKTVSVGKYVEKIGKKAFSNCSNLKKISFSTKTATIGTQCFVNCTKLKSVSLPNSTKTIGKEAFKNCKSLKKVTIGKKSSTKKGALPATGAGEQKVKAGKLTLKISIGNGAFQNCKSLRSVIINTQVKVIGNSAFKNCKTLASIIVRSMILKTVGKKALVGVSKCKISVPKKKYSPYKKLFKNKGQGKKVFVAKA